MNIINKNLSFSRRLLLFVCSFIFCYIAGVFLIQMIFHITGSTPAVLRISVIIQNMIVMVLPAVITTILVSRNALRFLSIDRFPNILQLLLTIAIITTSIPLMNWIVSWNESIHLPSQLSGLEEYLRVLEEAANATTKSLLDNSTVFSLIVTILSVGIFTGFSEELLFRGTLQRILQTRPMNIHIAIWLTAFIFSFIHFQFFGFIPRLLLGAYYGYLLWWTKSLWTPVLAHALNNSLIVANSYMPDSETATSTFDSIGLNADNEMTLITYLSRAATVILLFIFNRFYKSAE